MLSFCRFFCLINYCQLLQVRPHLPPNLLGKGNYFDEDYDCDGEYNDYDDSCDDEYDYMIMVVMIMMMVKFTWLTQALNVVNACPICKQDIPTWPMKS